MNKLIHYTFKFVNYIIPVGDFVTVVVPAAVVAVVTAAAVVVVVAVDVVVVSVVDVRGPEKLFGV